MIRTTHILSDKFQTCGGVGDGRAEGGCESGILDAQRALPCTPRAAAWFPGLVICRPLYSRFSHVNVKGNANIIKDMWMWISASGSWFHKNRQTLWGAPSMVMKPPISWEHCLLDTASRCPWLWLGSSCLLVSKGTHDKWKCPFFAYFPR